MFDQLTRLENSLANATTSLEKLSAMVDVARYWLMQHEVDRCYTFASQAYVMMSAEVDPAPALLDLKAEALLCLATVNEHRHDFLSALKCALQAQDIFEMFDNKPKMLRAYQLLGWQYFQLGDHAMGLKIAFKQLELAEEQNNLEQQGAAYNVLGLMYSQRKNFDFALKQYEKSLAIARQRQDTYHEVYALSNLASVCVDTQQYDRAIETAQQGLTINPPTQNPFVQANLLMTLSRCYFEMGQAETALSYVQKAQALADEGGLLTLKNALALLTGRIYTALERYELSSQYLQFALRLAERDNNKRLLADCHQAFAYLHEKQGDYPQALRATREEQRLLQQFFNDEASTMLQNLRVIYEVKQAHHEAEQEREMRKEDRHYFEQLSAMQSKLLNTASHDLKSPITGILLGIEMFKRIQMGDDPRIPTIIRRMEVDARRMQFLVTDLLDLAKLETGRALEVQAVEVQPFLKMVVDGLELLAESRNIQLRLDDQTPSRVTLLFDPQRMHQVVDNLLGNAIKYSPENSVVTLKVVADPVGLTFFVIDTGVGIPSQDLPFVFDYFYRVNRTDPHSPDGTGLGLTIAKTIIEQHDGHIWVDSIEGQGSSFGFWLPLQRVERDDA